MEIHLTKAPHFLGALALVAAVGYVTGGVSELVKDFFTGPVSSEEAGYAAAASCIWSNLSGTFSSVQHAPASRTDLWSPRYVYRVTVRPDGSCEPDPEVYTARDLLRLPRDAKFRVVGHTGSVEFIVVRTRLNFDLSWTYYGTLRNLDEVPHESRQIAAR